MAYAALLERRSSIERCCGISLPASVSLIAAICLSPDPQPEMWSHQKQALLDRKGKLPREIEYERERTRTRGTFAQAESLCEVEKAANQVGQANTHTETVGLGAETIQSASNNLLKDHERLDAINRGLNLSGNYHVCTRYPTSPPIS